MNINTVKLKMEAENKDKTTIYNKTDDKKQIKI